MQLLRAEQVALALALTLAYAVSTKAEGVRRLLRAVHRCAAAAATVPLAAAAGRAGRSLRQARWGFCCCGAPVLLD